MLNPLRQLREVTGESSALPLGVLFVLKMVDELDQVTYGVVAPNIRDTFGVSEPTVVAVGATVVRVDVRPGDGVLQADISKTGENGRDRPPASAPRRRRRQRGRHRHRRPRARRPRRVRPRDRGQPAGRMAHRARRAARARGVEGLLLFVSSLSGTMQGPPQATYNASKAGINALANTLRREVGWANAISGPSS